MTEPTMTPDSPSATDWQERAKQLEGWLNAAADAVGGCDLDMVASAIKVRLQSSPQPAPETDAPPVHGWRCFHCDEVFTSRESAATHFGTQIDGCADEVACKLNASEALLAEMLREAQEELRSYQQQDYAAFREFYALGADHTVKLREVGETGYARGLHDGRSHTTPATDAAKIRDAALEDAARLHESVDPASDAERLNGDPGAGAMGAVIEYRDKIRALKSTAPAPSASQKDKQ